MRLFLAWCVLTFGSSFTVLICRDLWRQARRL